MIRASIALCAALCGCGRKIPAPPDHAALVERDAHLELVELPSTTFRKFLVRESNGAFEVVIGTSDTPKLEPVALAAGSTSVAAGDFAGGRFAVVELPPGPGAPVVAAVETDLRNASVTIGDKQQGTIGGADVTTFPVEGLTHASPDNRASWQPGLRAALDAHIDQGIIGVYHVPRNDQIVLVATQIPPRDIAIGEAKSVFESFVAPARPDPVAP